MVARSLYFLSILLVGFSVALLTAETANANAGATLVIVDSYMRQKQAKESERLQGCLEQLPKIGLDVRDRLVIEWQKFSQGNLPERYYNISIGHCTRKGCTGSFKVTQSLDVELESEQINLGRITIPAMDIGCDFLDRQNIEHWSYELRLVNDGWLGDDVVEAIQFKVQDVLNMDTPSVELRFGENAQVKVSIER